MGYLLPNTLPGQSSKCSNDDEDDNVRNMRISTCFMKLLPLLAVLATFAPGGLAAPLSKMDTLNLGYIIPLVNPLLPRHLRPSLLE